jgi:Rieske Fe-S protein
MERKEFLKAGCKICLLGAAGYIIPSLSSCVALVSPVFDATVEDNKIKVPAKLFEQSLLQVIRPQGWYFDIAVQKKENNIYSALLLQCTHQDNQLTIASNGYSCSLHGSQFDKDGNILKGPAELSLKKFEVTESGNNIIIHL